MECRVCSRRFGSGRALGGHMRSHYTILPVPPKTQQLSQLSTSVTPSSSHSPVCAEDSVVLDCESETESKSMHSLGLKRDGKRTIRFRTELDKLGKMKKKGKKRSSTESAIEFDKPVSSVSKTSSDEEYLAMCLVLLSRDKWVSKASPVRKREQHFVANGTGDGDKNHGSPVCDKVFRSGQAIGGHKGCHLLSSTTATAAAAHPSVAANVWLIDLNLPAPLEDGEELSHSQVPVLC